MKRTDEIIQKLLTMISKSEHPLMDNSHILDTRKARNLLLELKKELRNPTIGMTEAESIDTENDIWYRWGENKSKDEE